MVDSKPESFVDTTPALVDVEPAGALPLDHLSEKRLVRKLDKHVLPPLTLLYLLSYLDRTNIGNAVIFGLKTDIHLKGNQFNTALAVFYVCYIFIEAPSNTMLKRTRASLWLPLLMILTSVMGISMGFVKDFSTLSAVRALLGIAEGGFWPGITWIVTQWYPRREAALRASIMFSAAGASGAFGGLLARAIEKMDGAGGLEGWRWIFILEGILTFAVTCAMIPFIQDSPTTAKFLTEEEKELVVARLATDNSYMPTDFKWHYIVDTLTSPLTYLMMLTQFGSYIGVTAFTTFSPTIVNAMGFTAGKAQLLTVPPYVMGCISTIIVGYYSDRMQHRFLFVAGGALVTFIGFMMLRFTPNVPVQYVGCCLVCIGALPLIPLEVAWNGNCQGGTLKRAVAIALQVGASNSGGIVASYVYIATEAPRYKTGHAVCAGFAAITLAFSSLTAAFIVYHNRRRERLYGSPASILAVMTLEEIDQEKERGDRARWWRYTL